MLYALCNFLLQNYRYESNTLRLLPREFVCQMTINFTNQNTAILMPDKSRNGHWVCSTHHRVANKKVAAMVKAKKRKSCFFASQQKSFSKCLGANILLSTLRRWKHKF